MNAHIVAALAPDNLVVVASDRLGVLHDVIATARAAAELSPTIDAVALTPSPAADASTGRNAMELLRLIRVSTVVSLRHAPADDLAHDAAVEALARALLG